MSETQGRPVVSAVYVDGQYWPPNSVPPADVAAKITNPKVWGQDKAKTATVEAPTPPAPTKPAQEPSDMDGDNGGEDADADKVSAKKAPGRRR
jgi:hypothetical protein